MTEFHVGDTVFFIPNAVTFTNNTSHLKGTIEHIGTDSIRVYCENEEYGTHELASGAPENLALVFCPHTEG